MPLTPRAVECARRIGDALRTVGYNDHSVSELTGTAGSLPGPLARLGPLLQRTSGGSPLDTLVRLFVVGARVDEGTVVHAISPTSLDEWLMLGLLERVGEEIRAGLLLRPDGDLVIAADVARRPGAPTLADDYVMGLSPSTTALARLTVRHPAQRALDVGTGGGYQAMRAAAHCRAVVATDLNPRALRMAELNLALNEIGNVEVRHGDLLEPAQREVFDLIVSNPPFIIGPDITHQFLSTARGGDHVVRELASGVPSLMADGGWCQFLANWLSIDGASWMDRVGSWFDGSGCDVWVIRIAGDAPDAYASNWICAATDDPAVYEQRFATWTRYFDDLGADGVGLGLVTLRRRDGNSDHWRRFDDVPALLGRGTGADIDRLVTLQTWLHIADDRAVVATPFVVAPSTSALARMVPEDARWRTEDLVLKESEGLGFGEPCSPELLRMLAQFDGVRTPGELVDAVDLPAVVSALRALVTAGLVEPVPS